MKYNIGDEITYNKEKWNVTKLYENTEAYRVERKQDNFYIRVKECEIEEVIYQQRLDKVLSKFRYIKYEDKYMYDKNYFDLWYSNGKFCLEDDENIISLDTVESLLKDLES